MKKLFVCVKSFFNKKYDYRIVSALNKDNKKQFFIQRRLVGAREWRSYSNRSMVMSFDNIDKAKKVLTTFKVKFNHIKLVEFNAYFKPVLTFN